MSDHRLPQATPPRTPAALPRLGRPHPSRLRRQAAAPGLWFKPYSGYPLPHLGRIAKAFWLGLDEGAAVAVGSAPDPDSLLGQALLNAGKTLAIRGRLRQRKALYRRRGERIARISLGAESGRQRFGRRLCRRGQRAPGQCRARAASAFLAAPSPRWRTRIGSGCWSGCPGVDPPGRLFTPGRWRCSTRRATN